MLERAFVAYDGSDEAGAAAELAMQLLPGGAQVTLASVVEAPLAFPETAADASGTEWLIERAISDREADIAQLMGTAPAGLNVDTAVVGSTETTATLLGMLSDSGADVLAVGRRGAGGLRRALLGSRSQQLLEHAPCPVLIAHEYPVMPPTPLVIAGVDGSAITSTVIAHAALAAERLGGELLLATVIESPTSRATLSATSSLRKFVQESGGRFLAKTINDAGLDPSTVQTAVLDGDAGDALVALVAERSPALMVVGDRGRQGFRGLLLGSAARKLVIETERPVLVVRS